MRGLRPSYATLGPLLVGVGGALGVAFGAKAPIGWGDSATYIDLAQTLPAVLAAGDVGYFGLRILPSAVVHAGLVGLGLPLSDASVSRAFEVWNVLLLILCAVGWGWLGRLLELGERILWLGFILLFVNFAVVGFGVAVPALTDTAALAIGLMQIWCYLARRSAALLGVSLAAAFTWPQAFVAGLVLFVFPRGIGTRREGRAMGWGIGLAAAVGYAALIWDLKQRGATTLPFAGQQIHWPLVGVSVVACGAYIAWLSASLFDRGLVDIEGKKGATARRAGIAIAAALLVAAVARSMGYSGVSRYPTLLTTPTSFLTWSVLTSIILPLLPLVAHIVYLGPVVVLAALRARAAADVVREWGTGMTLYAWGYGVLLLNPSSRVSISVLPLLVVAVCVVAKRERWPTHPVAVVAAVAVLLSRAGWPFWALVSSAGLHDKSVPAWVQWLRGWLPLRNLRPRGSPTLLEFPQQTFLMTQGPWMSVEMYAVQGACVLLLGGLLALALARAVAKDGTTGGGP